MRPPPAKHLGKANAMHVPAVCVLFAPLYLLAPMAKEGYTNGIGPRRPVYICVKESVQHILFTTGSLQDGKPPDETAPRLHYGWVGP